MAEARLFLTNKSKHTYLKVQTLPTTSKGELCRGRSSNWFEQKHSGYSLSGYDCVADENGRNLSVHGISRHPVATLVMPKEKFIVKNEELYESLMSCRWQPLDTVHSKIPDKPPQKHDAH
ncbi:unnamed protein product [Nyctereutes procyonoides]|uniref:(raccoon dog) hypothetical protein n=1 Tax=Nyctereutes procyonoides TaxID=34880 RepID=A0A811Y6Z3_NYCPR|nr:unnamed protein product [Nyctereutes procyonoides]